MTLSEISHKISSYSPWARPDISTIQAAKTCGVILFVTPTEFFLQETKHVFAPFTIMQMYTNLTESISVTCICNVHFNHFGVFCNWYFTGLKTKIKCYFGVNSFHIFKLSSQSVYVQAVYFVLWSHKWQNGNRFLF